MWDYNDNVNTGTLVPRRYRVGHPLLHNELSNSQGQPGLTEKLLPKNYCSKAQRVPIVPIAV